MNCIKQALNHWMSRLDYRSYLKYYRSLHQHQSECYAQILDILEHLRVHGASQSAVVSQELRERLRRRVAGIASVNEFYQNAIETALESTPRLSLKPITRWDGYLVLHDQENLYTFLSAEYLKLDLGISQLSPYYGYGMNARVLGAHSIGHLKALLRNLERNHQGQQRWLRSFRYFLVTHLGVHKASPEQEGLFKKPLKPSGSEQFLTLIAHCNRPSTGNGGTRS